MNPHRPIFDSIKALTLLTLLALLPVGCSLLDAPTSSNDVETSANPELWTPQPGDEIIPGREVPMLNEDYWETYYGQSVNPLRLPRIVLPIGEDGGTVTLGLHGYTIPAGAVDVPTPFILTYASMNAVAVDCGPSPFSFDAPVTVTLSFAGTQYEDWEENGLDPAALQVIYMASDGTETPLESTVDLEAQTVSAQVDHFSRYILG